MQDRNEKMKITVLIADDSKFIRKKLVDVISKHASIKIIDYATNGKEALEMAKFYKPDVLLLDIMMPKMSGLDVLENIMNDYPIPTIILSALNPRNMDISVQALLMGAFDYIVKPGGLGAKAMPEFEREIVEKILLAAKSQIKKIYKKKTEEKRLGERKLSPRQQLVNEAFQFGRYLNEITPRGERTEKNAKKGEKKPAKKETKTKTPETIWDQLKKEKTSKSASKIQKPKTSRSKPISKKEESQKPLKGEIKRVSNSTKKIRPKIESPTINSKEIRATQERSLKRAQKFKESQKLRTRVRFQPKKKLIVMGASVGGPKTLRIILQNIPSGFTSPILIVQHLDENFTGTYANTLNKFCKIPVSVGRDGEEIKGGLVYVAPGNKHMKVSVRNKKAVLKIYKGAPVNYCMPSIDVLFASAAKFFRNNVLGILLTGMGKDGVDGLRAIQKVGGKTIAESKETCVLYGMPKIAAQKGYADKIVPNYDISQKIINFSKSV